MSLKLRVLNRSHIPLAHLHYFFLCRCDLFARADGGDFPSAMLSLSALECGVCLSLVCQPISLSCGHSFCRSCLVSTLRRNKKKCPTCRAVCHNRSDWGEVASAAQTVPQEEEKNSYALSFMVCTPYL